jgi:hypothetical protein
VTEQATAEAKAARPQIEFGAFLKENAIWLVLAAGLIVRIWVGSLIGHESDLTQFETWSRDLADGGPFNFYEGEQFKDYLRLIRSGEETAGSG